MARWLNGLRLEEKDMQLIICPAWQCSIISKSLTRHSKVTIFHTYAHFSMIHMKWMMHEGKPIGHLIFLWNFKSGVGMIFEKNYQLYSKKKMRIKMQESFMTTDLRLMNCCWSISQNPGRSGDNQNQHW